MVLWHADDADAFGNADFRRLKNPLKSVRFDDSIAKHLNSIGGSSACYLRGIS